MRTDKSQAIKYRLQGHSYTEISKILGIPKSTLSTWLKFLLLSNIAKTRIASKYKAGSMKGLLKKSEKQTKQSKIRSQNTKVMSSKYIQPLSQDELLILGVALYWGEGYKKLKRVNGIEKTVHPVSLSNSDPALIKTFIKFLLKVCNVKNQQIKAGLRIYKHQNEKLIKQFWSDTTGIPISQFSKTYKGVSKSSRGKRPYNTLPYGTIQISVYNTELFYKIMGWLDGIQKQA